MLAQVRGHGEKKRAAAGNNNFLAFDSEAGLHQRLEAASAENVWQCPAGKRKESFARARAENQFFVLELAGIIGRFCGEAAGFWLVENFRGRKELGRGSF